MGTTTKGTAKPKKKAGTTRTKAAKAPKVAKMVYEPFDWLALDPHPVIGVDEVGRGCLAGPVYAAAAIVPPESVARLIELGVTDSKLLTSERRDELALEIPKLCKVAVAFATHDEIDAINILQASFVAMKRALIQLETQVTPFGRETAHIIVDGNQRIPMRGPGFVSADDHACLRRYENIGQTTIIKGDLRALPIAVASIMAKVARDNMMIEAATEFPQYGFEKHKGYAAPIHRQAIERHGPSRIHRKTFGGVREFLDREGRKQHLIQQVLDF